MTIRNKPLILSSLCITIYTGRLLRKITLMSRRPAPLCAPPTAEVAITLMAHFSMSIPSTRLIQPDKQLHTAQKMFPCWTRTARAVATSEAICRLAMDICRMRTPEASSIPLLIKTRKKKGAKSASAVFRSAFQDASKPSSKASESHYLSHELPSKLILAVSLFRGNFVIDVEVPKKLLDTLPFREDREFTRMRYTAATCDPDNFINEKYALRQVLPDPPRQTELMIVMSEQYSLREEVRVVSIS